MNTPATHAPQRSQLSGGGERERAAGLDLGWAAPLAPPPPAPAGWTLPGVADDGSTSRSAPPPTDDQPSNARQAGKAAPRDRSGAWLRNATVGLLVLAGASAAVSFSAQYRMVYAARHVAVIAALEAGIPDAAALIFASLGVALALHGRRAIRARLLNVASVAASVFMNVLAAAPGWKDAAIWAMPPVAYALASDTCIGVVRAWAIARHKALNERLADDEMTPLAIVGGLLLWLLRLGFAPASTVAGFRSWVLAECPVAPGRRAVPRQLVRTLPARALPASEPQTRTARSSRPGTKTAAFLALVEKRHGSLAGFPLDEVSRVSAALAPQVGLNAGAARTALRKAALAEREENPQ